MKSAPWLTLTSTATASTASAAAGAAHSTSVDVAQRCSFTASTAPNRHTRPPAAKPTPYTLISVPPAIGPLDGSSRLTAATTYSYLAPGLSIFWPSTLVSKEKDTTPSDSTAGVTQSTPSGSAVALQDDEPKIHLSPTLELRDPDSWMWTTVPPCTRPLLGVMRRIRAASRTENTADPSTA